LNLQDKKAIAKTPIKTRTIIFLTFLTLI
jgi:hypothetical protein